MKRGVFFEYFPPPEYLAMPALGFDISDRSIKYARLRGRKGVLEVSRFGARRVPKGIIESGEIKKKEKLVEFLGSVREELGARNVMVSLPEEKAFLSVVKLPPMKDEEIRGALELQLEEHVPLSPEDAIFDFEVLKGNAKRNSPSSRLDVNLVAFPKKLVEDYRDAFKGAGFNPLVFEMEAGAFARAVVPRGMKEPSLVVDFGRTRTTFAIVSGGKVHFTSTISVAGDHLNLALIKSLNIDESKAEKIKNERGLVRSESAGDDVFIALLPLVSAIKDEIGKHVNYWNSRLEKEDSKNKIEKIFLCGGDSNLPGFAEYLSYELKIPVELANPWVNIVSFDDYIPEIALKDSLMYAAALGLALRSVECAG